MHNKRVYIISTAGENKSFIQIDCIAPHVHVLHVAQCNRFGGNFISTADVNNLISLQNYKENDMGTPPMHTIYMHTKIM